MKFHKPVHKKVSLVVLCIIIGAVGVLWYFSFVESSVKRSEVPQITDNDAINDFDSCAKAGNPILESYPEQCQANGKVFTAETMSKTSVIESNLPDGWVSFDSASDDLKQANFNEGIGEDTNKPSCSLELRIEKINAESTDTITDTALFEQESVEIKENKGYVTNVIDEKEYTLQLNGLEQAQVFFEARLKLRDETGTDLNTIHTTTAYIVGKKDYASIKISCVNGNYDDIQSVLRAASIEIF